MTPTTPTAARVSGTIKALEWEATGWSSGDGVQGENDDEWRATVHGRPARPCWGGRAVSGPDFHDQLATLCGREVNAAIKAGDTDRAAGVVTALATMLGRSAARICHGDATAIDTLLTGADQLIAGEAAGMAGIMSLAASRKSARP